MNLLACGEVIATAMERGECQLHFRPAPRLSFLNAGSSKNAIALTKPPKDSKLQRLLGERDREKAGETQHRVTSLLTLPVDTQDRRSDERPRSSAVGLSGALHRALNQSESPQKLPSTAELFR